MNRDRTAVSGRAAGDRSAVHVKLRTITDMDGAALVSGFEIADSYIVKIQRASVLEQEAAASALVRFCTEGAADPVVSRTAAGITCSRCDRTIGDRQNYVVSDNFGLGSLTDDVHTSGAGVGDRMSVKIDSDIRQVFCDLGSITDSDILGKCISSGSFRQLAAVAVDESLIDSIRAICENSAREDTEYHCAKTAQEKILNTIAREQSAAKDLMCFFTSISVLSNLCVIMLRNTLTSCIIPLLLIHVNSILFYQENKFYSVTYVTVL